MATDSSDAFVSNGSAFDTEAFTNANRSTKNDIGRFNLAIIGNSGVGKSSLVNAVFGAVRAKVGRGLPVTEGINYYEDDALGIWDFEGFEIGTVEAPRAKLRAGLEEIKRGSARQQISVVWYCVLSTSDRLQRPEIEMIQELAAAGLPVVLVLTKVDWTRNPLTGTYSPPQGVASFKEWLERPDDRGTPIDLPVRDVVLTSTANSDGKGAGYGLGDLVAYTLSLAPDSDKDAFRVAQRLNLPWKREMARPAIAMAASAAAGAAAVPIPLSDAITLAPIQLGLMGRIAAIYELELETMMSPATLAQLGVQFAGRALATSFLKLIPGAGSAVNASVAFALTAAVGEAWMRICEAVHTGKIKPSEIGDAWKAYSPTLVRVIQKLVEQKAAR